MFLSLTPLPWARGERTSLICDLDQTYPSGALILQVITPLCSIGSSHTGDYCYYMDHIITILIQFEYYVVCACVCVYVCVRVCVSDTLHNSIITNQ